jgi:hypothetical protein
MKLPISIHTEDCTVINSINETDASCIDQSLLDDDTTPNCTIILLDIFDHPVANPNISNIIIPDTADYHFYKFSFFYFNY